MPSVLTDSCELLGRWVRGFQVQRPGQKINNADAPCAKPPQNRAECAANTYCATTTAR